MYSFLGRCWCGGGVVDEFNMLVSLSVKACLYMPYILTHSGVMFCGAVFKTRCVVRGGVAALPLGLIIFRPLQFAGRDTLPLDSPSSGLMRPGVRPPVVVVSILVGEDKHASPPPNIGEVHK